MARGPGGRGSQENLWLGAACLLIVISSQSLRNMQFILEDESKIRRLTLRLN